MERRSFVKKALGTAAAGTLLAGCSGNAGDPYGSPDVITRPSIRWRLASSFPPLLDTIFGAAEVMAERLAALTDGRFRVQVYPAGEMLPFDAVLSAVGKGTVEMGHAVSFYFTSANPALVFDACVPFGLTARQHMAWLAYGGGMDLLREMFADFNIVNFPGGNTGVQMGGWFRREVGSLAALQGLRIRMPGMGGSVMQQLGANAVTLSAGEIVQALRTDAIDAAEWIGPYDDEKLGLQTVARNYYHPGWWEPGSAITFYVNQDAYNTLPAGYKEALAAATSEAGARMLTRYDAQNPAALQRLIQAGVQLRPFPTDLMQAAQKATAAHLADGDRDGLYRRIHASYGKAADLMRPWFGTAEQSYANFVYGTPQPEAAATDTGDCSFPG